MTAKLVICPFRDKCAYAKSKEGISQAPTQALRRNAWKPKTDRQTIAIAGIRAAVIREVIDRPLRAVSYMQNVQQPSRRRPDTI